MPGDAVAIGYNSKNVWMMVTYYSSSTPKGATITRTRPGAREAASLDVRRRAGEGLAKVDVIAASDLTGFVAVARGENKSGNDVTVVGRGKSQAEAEKKALVQIWIETTPRPNKKLSTAISHTAPIPWPSLELVRFLRLRRNGHLEACIAAPTAKIGRFLVR